MKTLALAILALAVSAPCAIAQQYPTKPIRFLIPSPPGGGTDTLGRLFREGFTEVERCGARDQAIADGEAAVVHARRIPIDMTPSELGKLLERELEKWTKVIQAGNIQAN